MIFQTLSAPIEFLTHPEALTDRLLSHLRKKQLIRQDGPTLIIRDRTALEALTV